MRITLLLLTLLLFITGCSSQTVSFRSFGEGGSLPGQLQEPFDIAADEKGFLYVTDVRNKRVQKFSAEGKFLSSFGEKLFEKPSGIAVSKEGDILVTDFDKDKVYRFTSDGKLLQAKGKAGNASGAFNSPVDVATDSKGNIYVVDEYNHRIQKFSPKGEFLLSWGKKGKVSVLLSALNFLISEGMEGMFYYPSRIAIKTSGSHDMVYVSDAYNNRVQVFDTEGNFLFQLGGLGIWGGRFRVSAGLAVSKEGVVYVGDFYNNTVHAFDKNGRFLQRYGTAGSALGQLAGPTGVALGKNGELYITDWGNNRIQHFSAKR